MIGRQEIFMKSDEIIKRTLNESDICCIINVECGIYLSTEFGVKLNKYACHNKSPIPFSEESMSLDGLCLLKMYYQIFIVKLYCFIATSLS